MPHNEHSFPLLRDAIIFCIKNAIFNVIAQTCKSGNDVLKILSFIRSQNPTYIFEQKSFRL